MDNPFRSPGGRSFQQAGVEQQFVDREIQEAYREQDWKRANQLAEARTPQERCADDLFNNKLGGGRGGYTFERGEVFCAETKE